MPKKYYIVIPGTFYIKSRKSITAELKEAKFFESKEKANKYREEAGWVEGKVEEIESLSFTGDKE